MTFDPTNIPAELVAAVRRRDVVPFVGSGISKQASEELPNWRQLLARMATYAADQGYVEPDERNEVEVLIAREKYLLAAEHLHDVLPEDEFLTFLEDQFKASDVDPAEVHSSLWDLRPGLIVTTNYDTLLEKSYARRYGDVPTVMTYKASDAMQRAIQAGRLTTDPPMIFKVHGSIALPTEIILTERQYRELIYRQPGYRLVLSALFLTKVIVMLGFSGDDPELSLLLEGHRDSLKYRSRPDFALLPLPKGSVVARRLREDFGIQTIPYEPTAGHPEVLEFLRALVGAAFD